MGKIIAGVLLSTLFFAPSLAAVSRADFNNDKFIDLRDYAILAASFGTTDSNVILNPADAVVSMADVMLFAGQWLETVGPDYMGADLNHDRIVNFLDYAAFTRQWNANDLSADLNGDGVVDLRDLWQIYMHWLQTTPYVWYVDPVNGDDDNSGTHVSPWGTVSRAQTGYILKAGQAGRVMDGDTVMLIASDPCSSFGNFSENTTHYSPVTYKGYGGLARFGRIDLWDQSSNVNFDSVSVSSVCDLSGSSNVSIRNSTISYTGSRFDAPIFAVIFYECNNITIEHCEIANCKTAFESGNCNNIQIINNHVHGILVDCIEMTPADNVTIERNHFHELRHDMKVYKDPYMQPAGFTAAASGITVNDAAWNDLTITADANFPGGLAAILDLGDAPENGSSSAAGDFSHMLGMTVGFGCDTDVNSGDFCIRICSQTDCNGGDFEDIRIQDFDMSSIDPNKWGLKIYPANKLNTISIDDIGDDPYTQEIWDYDSNTPVLKAVMDRGNAIYRFTTHGSSPNPARTLGIVIKRPGPFHFYIDAGQGLSFDSGSHQDFVAGSGNNWVIKDNIFHDSMGQGIFATNGSYFNLLLEQNLFYDFTGTSLTHMDVGGDSAIRFNTFAGYLRFKPVPYSPYSPNYFAGNANITVYDPAVDHVRIYNNLVAGSLSLPMDANGMPATAFWDYNIIQSTSQVPWGVAPWPCYSARVPDVYDANFNDFFSSVQFIKNGRQLMDFHLRNIGGRAPNPVNFATTQFGMPDRGLGQLDSDNAFILDNGITRDDFHHSVGAYEYGF